ncbi:MAG: NADH-quinone oxidoreductase subunit N [Chloroflexi bacterium]|nr:NADH-quinone oxidoreductase subunit N [Chloroflexota bacterium]
MEFFNSADLLHALPLIFLMSWATILLLVAAFARAASERIMPALAAAGLLLTGYFAARQFGNPASAFNGMFAADGFSAFITLLLVLSGLLAIALSSDYLKRMSLNRPEYYVLMLFSITGMMLMASAADLIVVFLALELLSIPLYVLAAFAQPEPRSEEAGLKYFLLGAFASGFLLFGIALVYGATATTSLTGIFIAAQSGLEQPLYLLIGAALILVGLAFKVAAVPFHMWTPDVYEGSPTSVTAFMAAGAKIGGFAALIRIFIVALPSISEQIVPVLWALTALTLIGGNLLAIAQNNVKRMLAYSSISHAGFLLMALVVYGQDAARFDVVASALFYLLAFIITSSGSWGVVIALEKQAGKGLEFSDYAGLGRTQPVLALAMAVFMLSFTGVPPTLGFAGKFYLFRAVLEGEYVGLAILGMLASLISAYYYLRLIVVMYMQTGNPKIHSERWLNLTTVGAAIGVVVLFFASEPLFDLAALALLHVN